VLNSTDCNDASSAVYPNAVELCANLAVDNNCNGSTAESEATDRVIFFADTDHDGAGDAAITSLNCFAPAGFVAIAGDNCPSNGALTAPITYYRDTDNDGAGEASNSAQFCNSTAPAGYSANSNDGCPVDANKTTPGTCGCGVADTDTDSDGTPDCTDGCPTNPNKTAPGTCGCGVADTDTAGDGRANCVDNCPTISNADQRDCNANSIGDVCEIAAGTGADCNANGLLDSCDIGTGISTDLDSSGSPDECELVVGGTGFATIQDALDQAQNGTTIMVGPGTYPPFVVFKRGLTVRSIAGERLTHIDGGNNARCIEITGRAGARFTVRGFTVQRGWADEGAGMLINDADPVIDHCIFTNNIATGAGGAIRAINGSADITVTSFLFNSAGSGGAISTSNLAASTAVLYVSNSILRQNSAATDGGAIVNAGHMQLLECTIEQNVAGGLGGGVKQTAIGNLTVFTSRFCRNIPDNINGAFTVVGDNVLSQDCNHNGVCDIDEILSGAVGDCNANGLPDACEISSGAAGDCNANGIPDSCDITRGTSADVDANGIPDECKPDCNHNSIPDAYEIATGAAFDCNTNGVLDSCEIAAGTATDCNTNGVLDSCEIADGTANDCNSNGVIDTCDVAAGAADADHDGRLDRCEFARGDLNLDGVVNAVDLAIILTNWGPATTGDTNADGIVNAFDLGAVLANWGVLP
ncbi:MAG: MopE-related protein, partial [Planctomycetota bacterium]